MRYLMLVCAEPGVVVDPEEASPEAWLAETERRGVRVMGNRLGPTREARTVRVRRGERLVTDGPFAETKELLGGFDILECESLEEAVEIASMHPVASFGAIEVRPFWAD